ncbi:hypothetical protein [Acinetobacter pittii]|uniref:hypothetical protein n=1 Tax=Acinetobacter pittii TaxID=48296 RepID=UPI00300B960E
MFKTKLEKKIRKIGVFFILAFLAYLFLAFLLLSKYPLNHYEFDSVKSYEVLKDGLTLAATFLASVVAFVLFSHWSEQHSLIRNERDIIQLLKEAKDITNTVEDIQDYITSYYERTLTVEELTEYEKRVEDLLPRIYKHSEDLKESGKNFTNNEFHNVCYKMHQKQLNLLYRILALLQTCKDLENSKVDPNNRECLSGLIYQEQKVSARYFKTVETYTLYSEEIKPQIEKLADEHRIK